MADIFISYKRSRREVVAALAKVLEAHGWTVWYDAALTEGERFRSEIERELAAARCAIAIWCDQSIVADFVLDEAGWAKAQGALVQVRWMAVEPPLGFRQQQQVDLIEWRRGVSPKIQKLIDAVERLIGSPEAPTKPSMGRPTDKAKAAAASEEAQATSWVSSSELPLHLAVQVQRSLQEALAEHARFDLRLLHPAVRVAVEVARRFELASLSAQFRALHAVELAEEAARRARAGESGYAVQELEDDDRYEGAIVGGKRGGHGIYRFGEGAFKGDRYAGQYRGGSWNGVGIYSYANRSTNPSQSLSHAGEFLAGKGSGAAYYQWRNGDVYAGGYSEDKRHGAGVYRHANGQRFEGEYVGGDRNGSGVLWKANGEISIQGAWADNVSTERF